MRPIQSLPVIALTAALFLGACSDAEVAEADSADGAAEVTPDAGDGGADGAAGVPEDHDGIYAENMTDGELNDDELTAANTRLAEYHASSGNDVRLILTLSTEGRDIDEMAEEMRAERQAKALILIAGMDEQLTIVGDGMSSADTESAEAAMIEHFENNDAEGGMMSGIDFVISQLDS